MKKLFLIISFFLSNGHSFAQVNAIVGVRQNGLANTAATLSDLWSVKNNPGAFAFVDTSAVGVLYQNRFLVSEMSTQGVAYGHHFKKSNIGFFIQHTGFNLYRLMQVGGTYSMVLSPRLGMGISANYLQTRFGDIYGVKHHFSADLGVKYKLNDEVSVGASVLNINRSKVSDFENERLPTLFSLGIKYIISEKVLWLIDLDKEISSPLNIKTGLELAAHENFDIRLGINSYPFQSAFGFGIHINQLDIDMAAVWHSKIGLTPSLGIVYDFK